MGLSVRIRSRLLYLTLLVLAVSLSCFSGPTSHLQQQVDFLMVRQGIIKVGLGQWDNLLRLRAEGPWTIENEVGAKLSLSAADECTVDQRNANVIAVSSPAGRISGHVITVQCPSGRLIVGKRRYCGSLVFEQGIKVANLIFLEDYLRGVLAAEMGDAPLEALKAQAIVARSEVVHKLLLRRHKAEGFDLCATEHCMAYRGDADVTPAMRCACEETRGQVLLADGQVLDAVFHTCCGGITAGAEDVWDSAPIPGLQPVWDQPYVAKPAFFSTEDDVVRFLMSPPGDSYCSSDHALYPEYARKYFRWSKSYSWRELEQIAGVGHLKDIRIAERRPSGRVRKLLFDGDRGTRVVEKELPIRRLLDLPSGLFVIKILRNSRGEPESVEFYGAGSGHGVGLCQMGAWTMAQKGATCSQILKHYFPRATLAQLYR